MKIFNVAVVWSMAVLGAACSESPEASLQEVYEPKPLIWHENYADAIADAKAKQQFLLVYFRDAKESEVQRIFEQETLLDPEVNKALANYVLARIPVDTMSTKVTNKRLIDRPAFGVMLGKAGYAIVDFKSTGTSYYEYVVSGMPFVKFPILGGFSGVGGDYLAHYRPWRVNQFREALALPAQSIKVRSLIFAVRIHPDRYKSTIGSPFPLAVEIACDQSRRQSRMNNVTHSGSRFGELAQFGGSASEIAAPTYSNNITAASLEAVAGWSGSPPHLRDMRAAHKKYGYCLDKTENGRWFATGDFAG